MPAPIIAAAAKYAAAKLASKLSSKLSVKKLFGKKKKKKVAVQGLKQPVPFDVDYLKGLTSTYKSFTRPVSSAKAVNKRIGLKRIAKLSLVGTADAMTGGAVSDYLPSAYSSKGGSMPFGRRRRRRRKTGLQGREIGQLVLMKSLLGPNHPATLVYAIKAVQGSM